MELNDELRAQLDGIHYRYDSFNHGPVDGERRPTTKPAYRKKQRTLKAFAKAWHALDLETQWDVFCGLRGLWEEVENQPYDANRNIPPPDAGRVMQRLLHEMEKTNGSPEVYPGFGEATLLLWTAYIENRPPWVKIDDEACAEIGAVIANIFGLEHDVARMRVKSWLNEREKNHDLPGRERPPKSLPFP